MWRWVCEGVQSRVGAPRGKRPSGRMLMCGAVAFLWDRERIGNEEVARYVYIAAMMYTVHDCTCTCTCF